MNDDYTYIKRCLALAVKGAGFVAPNPLVGAVLVYRHKIIGEGWHRVYGEAHAEVNCINSVKDEDKHLIEQSTLYVSLEPCSHFGKTPPCTGLILRHNIKKVVIGCVDSFTKVNGSGIQKLRNAGVETVLGDWQNECKAINKRFFTYHEKKRPYIILKWAQTADQKIAGNNNERLRISNDLTNRLVHKWRSEEAAIMVGKNTAMKDNPSLSNRLWSGKNPVRIVIDKNLELPAGLNIFNREAKTVIFNFHKEEIKDNLHFTKIADEKNLPEQVMQKCFEHDIQSILVEGGAQLHRSFIDAHLWDECRIITNEALVVAEGLASPALQHFTQTHSFHLQNDRIDFFVPVAEKTANQ